MKVCGSRSTQLDASNAILLSLSVARNNLFFVCVGLGIGTTGGILLGMWMARPHFSSPVMRAIACFSFKDADVSSPHPPASHFKILNCFLRRT